MNIRFNTLCSLIKQLQISSKSDIKRLKSIIPSVVNAINEHPAHTSLLLYHLSKSTSKYNINHQCKTCKGLCNITFQILLPYTFHVLDLQSPKSLAQILLIYSNCINDTITEEIQARISYFILSYLKFPNKYISYFDSWVKDFIKSPDDYLNKINSNQSRFYLDLVVHDVADLIQSSFQILSRFKSKRDRIKHQDKTNFILQITMDYIEKLLKTNLNEKQIHGITRIFYYYNELNYFSDNVKSLWIHYMDNFINIMNVYDICTMLHSFKNPLDNLLIQKLDSRINFLLSDCNIKNISMLLNAMFKCNVNSPSKLHSQIKKLLNSQITPIELFQATKALSLFDLHVDDMIVQLHKISKSNLSQFDLYDLSTLLKWYNKLGLDVKFITDFILSENLIENESKFDTLYRFTLEVIELQNDNIVNALFNSLKQFDIRRIRLEKLITLYEMTKQNIEISRHLSQVILNVITSGDLTEFFKSPLKNSEFIERIGERIKSESKITPSLIVRLCRNSWLYNIDLLPIELIMRDCNLEELSIILQYIPEYILPNLDIKLVIRNTKKNKNLSLYIYRCILNGVRGDGAGILIDYFIELGFSEFKEMMMLCILSSLPGVSINHSHMIVDYFQRNCHKFKSEDQLDMLNRLMPILNKSYDLCDRLVKIGLDIIKDMRITRDVIKFVCYCIRFDGYRNSIVCNVVDSFDDNNFSMILGGLGLQYWPSEKCVRWFRRVYGMSNGDLYMQIQLRIFLNPRELSLVELKLIDKIIGKIKFNDSINENPIIRQVEESIDYERIINNKIRPRIDLLILP